MKIILSTVVALFLLGCGESKSTSHEAKSVAPAKTEVVEKVAVVEEKVAPKEEKVVVAEERITPTQTTKVVAEEVVPEVEAVAEEVVPASKAIVQEVKTAVKEAPKSTAVDAAKIYVACAGCHGVHGEKKALGKSQVIQGWEASKVVTALQGYKDGTYGGAMKGVMKGQASKLNDAQIKALAEYISKL